MTAAAEPAPGGAAADPPKKDERAVPPPPPAQVQAAKEKPPELAADALNGLSARIDRLEKKPATTVGVVGIFFVVVIGIGAVLGVVALVVRLVRRPTPTLESENG